MSRKIQLPGSRFLTNLLISPTVRRWLIVYTNGIRHCAYNGKLTRIFYFFFFPNKTTVACVIQHWRVLICNVAHVSYFSVRGSDSTRLIGNSVLDFPGYNKHCVGNGNLYIILILAGYAYKIFHKQFPF